MQHVRRPGLISIPGKWVESPPRVLRDPLLPLERVHDVCITEPLAISTAQAVVRWGTLFQKVFPET